jgi:hypothetical protein
MSQNLFPVEITETEIKLGFKLSQIENPNAYFSGASPTVNAVVFDAGPSRIVKAYFSASGKTVEYWVQKMTVEKGKAEWKTGNVLSNPENAINEALS